MYPRVQWQPLRSLSARVCAQPWVSTWQGLSAQQVPWPLPRHLRPERSVWRRQPHPCLFLSTRFHRGSILQLQALATRSVSPVSHRFTSHNNLRQTRISNIIESLILKRHKNYLFANQISGNMSKEQQKINQISQHFFWINFTLLNQSVQVQKVWFYQELTWFEFNVYNTIVSMQLWK